MKAAIKYTEERNKQQGVQGCSIKEIFQQFRPEHWAPFSFFSSSLSHKPVVLLENKMPTSDVWNQRSRSGNSWATTLNSKKKQIWISNGFLIVCHISKQDNQLLSDHPPMCDTYSIAMTDYTNLLSHPVRPVSDEVKGKLYKRLMRWVLKLLISFTENLFTTIVEVTY